ncbi:hypothetical protein HRR83_003200 [Exophiala dermatitidis]|uniref:Uncharacterized protein n=1 Tax=Exophiala dermatitidis TaxID=5970 RepID=A0AAN6IW19_EXODE|nr:hypothetical protein HRR74_004644 [Exophiala dermatitidis]KAJ4521247.1 hypothetical protein HRR73_003588 [Exophiala dermatitidis]KAJ4547839.1 hypothetical protein HRR76_000462 [Exophiala dermatitidis]KAJ4553777.1 hypothetical protein HRR77_002151 [Exophiala dermatitidis]KAJ4578105.1 hypothetical protein HRR79_001423 [Exophiala dermatitidis]
MVPYGNMVGMLLGSCTIIGHTGTCGKRFDLARFLGCVSTGQHFNSKGTSNFQAQGCSMEDEGSDEPCRWKTLELKCLQDAPPQSGMVPSVAKTREATSRLGSKVQV